MEKTYKFWGWENIGRDFVKGGSRLAGINDPIELYDALSNVWCEHTCAPRLRDKWSTDNMTVGQCSITSFLIQDIFGGEVYGIPLPEGGYHCFNVVGSCRFDLTSEQFGDAELDYINVVPQSRDEHFADKDKYERYQYLRQKLMEYAGAEIS